MVGRKPESSRKPTGATHLETETFVLYFMLVGVLGVEIELRMIY